MLLTVYVWNLKKMDYDTYTYKQIDAIVTNEIDKVSQYAYCVPPGFSIKTVNVYPHINKMSLFLA